MKHLNKYKANKIQTLVGFNKNKSNNKSNIKNYSNFLGFKTLNLTPNVHFEDWGEIARNGIYEKNRWHYDSDGVEDEDDVLHNQQQNYSEEDLIDSEWENNYKFKLGNNWVGFDEDVSSSASSGQERISYPKRRNIQEMFYEPALEEFALPKEKERNNYFTIEDVPEDITMEEINGVLGKLINKDCVSIQKFQIQQKTHIFVELNSKETKSDFLNNSRLNFGIWLKGKRCDVYDSSKRQRNVFLAKIPRTSSEEEVKTFINKIMQEEDVDVQVKKNYNNAYCFLDFKKHSSAANFIERIHQIGDHHANWGKGTQYSHKKDIYSVFDESLIRLKERLKMSQHKMMKYQSILELNGYKFDSNGDLILSDQQQDTTDNAAFQQRLQQNEKQSSSNADDVPSSNKTNNKKKSTTTKNGTTKKRSSKTKVDVSTSEDN